MIFDKKHIKNQGQKGGTPRARMYTGPYEGAPNVLRPALGMAWALFNLALPSRPPRAQIW